MSSTTPTLPLSAGAFLLGGAERGDPAEVLARKLGEQDVARSTLGGVRRVSHAALQAVDCEIARVAAGLLDADLADGLVSAWRRYSAMTDAAERTRALPGTEEVVVLASHRVAWTYQPRLDVLVDGVRIATIELETSLVFDLDGVVAVVRLGTLVALRGGACTITATLTVDRATVAHQRRRMDVALVVPLDPPLPLLADPATTRPATYA